MKTMATKIIAKCMHSDAYALGDGDPQKTPMMPVRIARLDDGCVYPPVPLQEIFKFGEWEDPADPNDPALLKKLLALPPAK